jgi:PAP2 superfamily/Bacterial Ig-like domain
MPDALLAPLPNSPTDTIFANLQQSNDTLSIGTTLQRGLLDPLPANSIQPSDAQIVQTLTAGVTGLALSDLSQTPALNKLAEQVATISAPISDLADLKIPSASVDALLGVAATAPLVISWTRMGRGQESIAPQLTVGLFNDTGSSNSDRLTRNPAIQGTVKDDSRIGRLQAQLDNGKSYNIASAIRRSGKFYLDRAEIYRINGGQKLTEGQHTIEIEAVDVWGNKSNTSIDFTLDSIAPLKPGFALTSGSDTGILGDYKTTLDRSTLNGVTEANATVSLRNGYGATQTIQATATGQFTFVDVALNTGDNRLMLTAVDAAGNRSSFQKTVTRTDIDPGDVITDWNATTLRAIQTSKTAPPVAAYNLALVHGAIFDAVNSIERKYTAYQVADAIAPANASQEAAAAAAAHKILIALYPSLTSTFDAQFTKSLARVTDGQAETDGVTFGESIADQFLGWRKDDGSKTIVPYTPDTTNPAEWQPTAPSNAPALLPGWGGVKPFAMTSDAQFRPDAPPAMDGAQYASEYNQTKQIGSLNSTTRTADQTETALFWADGGGTYTPPGHWNQIAEQVTVKQRTSLIDNARLFAALNISLADAGISCWEAKYTYKSCRPITAIRNGENDNNPLTVGDTTWQPLIVTPPFPEYTSGHSTFSGAASTVLASFFGANYSFSTNSLGLPGTNRQFTSFSQAADEAGMSRIYGGIHYMSANLAGLDAGRKLGSYVVNNFVKTVATAKASAI